VTGVLLHSISSDDVTAVRNQPAIDMMSRDFNMPRDSAIHHRRRRDRAICDYDESDTDTEIGLNQEANSVHKQDLTNQNATATLDNAHDPDVTNQSSQHHNLSSTLSVLETSLTNNVTTRANRSAETPAHDEGSRDHTKPKSFSSFLRKLTQFRMTSSKRAMPIKLISYTITDDVEPLENHASSEHVRTSTVSRHESLITYDVTAESRRQRLHPEMTSSTRNVFAESKRHPALQRYDSDLTLTKSRRKDVVASQDDEERGRVMTTSKSPQRHHSLISHDISQDRLTSKSPSILKLAGQSSVKGSLELVRHGSLLGNDYIVQSKNQELMRHKSQPIIATPSVISSRSQHARQKSRNESLATFQSDKLVRHKSLPTLSLSTNGSVISSAQQSSRTKSRPHDDVLAWSHSLPLRRDTAVSSSRSHDIQPTMTTSYHDDVTTSRLRNPARLTVAPNNASTDNDLDSSLSRHNPLTSRPTSHDHVVTKSSSTSKLRRSSSSTKRGQQTLTVPRGQQNVTRILPSSSSSTSSSSSQIPRKPPSLSKSHVSSSAKRNQIMPDSTNAIPTPKQNVVSQVKTSSVQSSSSNSQEQVTGKPPSVLKSYSLSSSTEQNQRSSDSAKPVPALRQTAHQIQPSSPLPSSSSSGSRGHVTIKQTSVSKPTKQNQTRSDSIKPVPAPRQIANQISLSLSSSSSNNKDKKARMQASVSKPAILSSTEQNRTRSNSTKPVPTSRHIVSQIPPSSPLSSSSTTSSRIHEHVRPKPKPKPSWTSPTERNQTKSQFNYSRRTSSLQQASSQTTSSLSPQLSSSTSSAFDHNSVLLSTATNTQDIGAIVTTAPLDYNLTTYQDNAGAQIEASADGADALDEPLKTRSIRETAINALRATATESKLPLHQDGGLEEPDDPDDLPESRSRREIANVVVVRPLPAASGHAINDVITKSRSRRETPIAAMTGSDDEDDMRSRRNSTSGVRAVSRKKSSLRKASRSQSSDRHVSYSNTDTVYKSVRLCFHELITNGK